MLLTPIVRSAGIKNIFCKSKVSKQKIANAVADNLSKSHKEDIRNRAEEFRKQLSEDLKQYREE